MLSSKAQGVADRLDYCVGSMLVGKGTGERGAGNRVQS
jgi:hypothetical protein